MRSRAPLARSVLEHGFRTLLTEGDALARLRAGVEPLPRVERVAIEEADGRVVHADVRSPRDAPHYDRCAMDGYAVRAEDTAGASLTGPVVLALGEAGGPEIAVRVHTGSPLPAGSNAVVPVEDAEAEDGRVAVVRRVRVGEHVGPRGEDVRRGDPVAAAGRVLQPADLALLRALGVEDVGVRARPRVRVLVTGEELVAPGGEPPPGRMVDSNGLLLAAAIHRWGGLPDVTALYTDDLEALTESLSAAACDADLVVTSGGTSVGVRDQVVEALASRGEVWFHGVAIQPARPVAAGLVGGTPVLALPGFPAAAFVAAFALLRPLLAHLAGASTPDPALLRGVLARKVVSTLGLRTYVRVAVSGGRVEPVRASGAGLLSTLTRGRGFLVVPEESEGVAEGSAVEIVPYP